MIIYTFLFMISLLSSAICCGFYFKYEEQRSHKILIAAIGWMLSSLICVGIFVDATIESYTQGAIDHYHNKIKVTEIIRTQSEYKIERINDGDQNIRQDD